MLPYTVRRDIDVAWRRIRRVAKWVRHHKIRTVAIVVGAWLTLSLLGGHAIMAFAADGEGIQSLPYLSPLNPKDSGGVDLLHYTFLPYDCGHPLTSPKNFFVSQITDPIWMANIFGLSWSMWFLQFLISMEWVAWLATPLEWIMKLLADGIAQIGWVTTGLIIAGIIVTVSFFRGQLATGMTKMLISISAFALAGTLLANPVGMVTGPGGFLQTAQQGGAAISASIASNDATLLNKPPAADQAKQIVSDALLSQVMDAWVRLPAQEVAFGHVLEGQCADTFNKVMMEVGPLDTGGSKVLDAVKACDPAAGEYAMNPTIANAFTAGIAAFGAQILNLLSTILGLMLMVAIGYAIFKACQWAFANLAVIATFGYQAWWAGLIGSLIGAIAVALMLITVAAFLSIVTGMMKAVSGIPGMSTIAQLGFLDVVVVTALVVLVWQWFKAKKAGEKLAERLARLTGGIGAGGSKSHPIRQTVGRVVERYVGNKMSGMGSSTERPALPSRPIPPRPTPEVAQTPTPAPTALPAGSPRLALDAAPAEGKTTLRDKAGKLLVTGAQVGMAAASGGTSAAVIALTKEGGKYVLQRGFEHATTPSPKGKDTSTGTDEATGTNHRPTFTGYGRRIVVDENGESRIAPREAPSHGGVYRITPASTQKAPATPKAPTPSTSTVRERLQRAVTEPQGAKR